MASMSGLASTASTVVSMVTAPPNSRRRSPPERSPGTATAPQAVTEPLRCRCEALGTNQAMTSGWQRIEPKLTATSELLARIDGQDGLHHYLQHFNLDHDSPYVE